MYKKSDKKCIRNMELVKLVKVLEKYPKLKVTMNSDD